MHLSALALSLHPLLIPRVRQLTQFFECCCVPSQMSPLGTFATFSPPLLTSGGQSLWQCGLEGQDPGAPDLHLNHDHAATIKSLYILGSLLCKADTIHMTCWVRQLEMMCAQRLEQHPLWSVNRD